MQYEIVTDYDFVPECTCDPKGTEDGLQCAHNPNGDCRCRNGVIGFLCDKCDIGYYGADSESGCKSKRVLNKQDKDTVNGSCLSPA